MDIKPAPQPDPLPGGAVATVLLWLATEETLAYRLTTVDDLAAPDQQQVVTTDLDEVMRRLVEWIATMQAKLQP